MMLQGIVFASSAPNQVSVHQCRGYPPCIVLASEQWNLSEAGESAETSGTKGYGVHHYLREPRHAGTLEHQRS